MNLDILFSGMPIIDYGVVSFLKRFYKNGLNDIMSGNDLHISIPITDLSDCFERAITNEHQCILTGQAKKYLNQFEAHKPKFTDVDEALATIHQVQKKITVLSDKSNKLNNVFDKAEGNILTWRNVAIGSSAKDLKKNVGSLIQSLQTLEKTNAKQNTKHCPRCGCATDQLAQSRHMQVTGIHSNANVRKIGQPKTTLMVCLTCHSAELMAELADYIYWTMGSGKKSTKVIAIPALSSFKQYALLVSRKGILLSAQVPADSSQLNYSASSYSNLKTTLRSRLANLYFHSDTFDKALLESAREKFSPSSLNADFSRCYQKKNDKIEGIHNPFKIWEIIDIKKKHFETIYLDEDLFSKINLEKKKLKAIKEKEKTNFNKTWFDRGQILGLLEGFFPTIKNQAIDHPYCDSELDCLLMNRNQAAIYQFNRKLSHDADKLLYYHPASILSDIHFKASTEQKKDIAIAMEDSFSKTLNIIYQLFFTGDPTMEDPTPEELATLGKYAKSCSNGISFIKSIENARSAKEVLSTVKRLLKTMTSDQYASKNKLPYFDEMEKHMNTLQKLKDLGDKPEKNQALDYISICCSSAYLSYISSKTKS